MFGLTMRHFRRYQEIVSVFIRNGLGSILLEYFFLGNDKARAEADWIQLGQRIRRALSELGPTFMKIGQFASTRPDIIPKPVLRELEQLQDRAPWIPYEIVRRMIEQELGAPIKELFHEFSPYPLAAASIGQVHYAVLHSGEPVVIKVQRPHIAELMATDLEIMNDVITLLEQRYYKAKDYALHEILEEFSAWLAKELDYLAEGENAEKMAKGVKRDRQVIIPRVFRKFTTRHVLTLAYVDGVKLNDWHRITELGYDKKAIAACLSKALLQQIIKDGFFHGDPHPGNIFVLSEERIAFVDFGIVGKLTPLMKRRFANLIGAMTRRNTKSMAKAMLELGVVSQTVDFDRLQQDLDKLRKRHLDVPITQTSLSELVSDLLDMAANHHLEIPSDFILLGKSLLTLEGIIHELDPGISVVDLVKPFRYQFIKDRFLIGNWLKTLMPKSLPAFFKLKHDNKK